MCWPGGGSASSVTKELSKTRGASFAEAGRPSHDSRTPPAASCPRSSRLSGTTALGSPR